jgi:hypothetical protein
MAVQSMCPAIPEHGQSNDGENGLTIYGASYTLRSEWVLSIQTSYPIHDVPLIFQN